MKGTRGLGNVYQPSFRDRNGKLKHTSTWWIVYHVNGRRIAENAHSTNRADAVRLLKSRIADAAAGKPVGREIDRTKLDDLLAMVEADYQANSRRSLDRVRQASNHLRAFFHAERRARDIMPDLITRYAAQRLEDGARASTVNYEMAVLRRGFRLAAKNGKVAARPEFSMLHVNNARKGFFEPEQYRAVLFHLPDYLEPVASVGYITGWRVKSEVLTRQWRHVDFVSGWLRLEPGESKTTRAANSPSRLICAASWKPSERACGNWNEPAAGSSRGYSSTGMVRRSAISDMLGPRLVEQRAFLDGSYMISGANFERAGVPRSAAMKMTGHKTEAVYRRYAITDATMLQEAAVKLAVLHAAEAGVGENRKSNAKVSPNSAGQ